MVRAGIGNMLKAIACIDCGSVGQEIGDPESGRQDEVELAGLLRNLPGEIGPEGTSGEFGIGPDPVQCDEGVFEFRVEADAVRENRFLELDINYLGAEGDLTPIPTVADWIGQRHHPGGHEGHSLLLRSVVLFEMKGEHVAGGESDLLSANGDRRRAICAMHAYSSQERPQSQCCEDPSKKWHATFPQSPVGYFKEYPFIVIWMNCQYPLLSKTSWQHGPCASNPLSYLRRDRIKQMRFPASTYAVQDIRRLRRFIQTLTWPLKPGSHSPSCGRKLRPTDAVQDPLSQNVSWTRVVNTKCRGSSSDGQEIEEKLTGLF